MFLVFDMIIDTMHSLVYMHYLSKVARLEIHIQFQWPTTVYSPTQDPICQGVSLLFEVGGLGIGIKRTDLPKKHVKVAV